MGWGVTSQASLARRCFPRGRIKRCFRALGEKVEGCLGLSGCNSEASCTACPRELPCAFSVVCRPSPISTARKRLGTHEDVLLWVVGSHSLVAQETHLLQSTPSPEGVLELVPV